MVFETAISLGVVLTAFILIYVGTKLKSKDFVLLQNLFLIIGLVTIYVGLVIMGLIATGEGQTEINNILVSLQLVMIGTILFLIGYIIVIFFKETMRNLFKLGSPRDRKPKRKERFNFG